MDKRTTDSAKDTALAQDAPYDDALSKRLINEGNWSPKLVGFLEKDINARPFKLLRTTLNRQLVDHDHRVIGVTSCTPNAGKSFVASNLAASMSRLAHRKTVLVDLDLHRASVAELFGISAEAGTIEFLLGDIEEIREISWQTGDGGLTVIPTMARDVNSAELLASERLADLMVTLRADKERPLIICDLPPLFVNDDTLLAAQHLDGVLIVVEQGVTTRKQLEAAMRMLYPTRLIGTVFNRFSGGLGDPYAYGGGYGGYY
jgi:Mrp family chromosome partitioning ATPase